MTRLFSCALMFACLFLSLPGCGGTSGPVTADPAAVGVLSEAEKQAQEEYTKQMDSYDPNKDSHGTGQ